MGPASLCTRSFLWAPVGSHGEGAPGRTKQGKKKGVARAMLRVPCIHQYTSNPLVREGRMKRPQKKKGKKLTRRWGHPSTVTGWLSRLGGTPRSGGEEEGKSPLWILRLFPSLFGGSSPANGQRGRMREGKKGGVSHKLSSGVGPFLFRTTPATIYTAPTKKKRPCGLSWSSHVVSHCTAGEQGHSRKFQLR